jgi:hypothetical protein
LRKWQHEQVWVGVILTFLSSAATPIIKNYKNQRVRRPPAQSHVKLLQIIVDILFKLHYYYLS